MIVSLRRSYQTVASTPWRRSYSLYDVQVTYSQKSTLTSTTIGLIAAISFYWCELISASNYKLGCVPRPNNFYRSTIGMKAPTTPPFNPFKKDSSTYSQSLKDLESIYSIQRFTDSRILSIKFSTIGSSLTSQYPYQMQMVMVEGQTYTWQHPTFTTAGFVLTTSQIFMFSTTQYAIAVYGEYDNLKDTLKSVGFTYYDSLAAGCACSSATISGSLKVTNTSVSRSNSTTLQLLTSSLTDTVSSSVGITTGISHFCGEYKFSLSSPSVIAPALVPDMVALCSSDCGYYDNYTLATVSPDSNHKIELVAFNLIVDFLIQPALVKFTYSFNVEVTQCQTEFSLIMQTEFPPIYQTIGQEGSLKLAEFKTTNNANCGYKSYLRAWVPSPLDNPLLPQDYQQLPNFIIFVQDDFNPLLGTFNFSSDQFIAEMTAFASQNQPLQVAIQGVIDDFDSKYYKESTIVLMSFIFKQFEKFPDYLQLGPGYLKPVFTPDTKFSYKITQGDDITFFVQAYDPDGSSDGDFGMKIDMFATRFISNFTYNQTQHLYNFTLNTTLSTPPKNYTILASIYNITDNSTIQKKTLTIQVIQNLRIATFEQKSQDNNYTAEYIRLLKTKFTVSDVSNTGLVKIQFSNPLFYPKNNSQEGSYDFSVTPSSIAFATYLPSNPYAEEVSGFSYVPVNFDKSGLWCTIKLTFDNPLIVSTGDFNDQVQIYFLKSYFLKDWVQSNDTSNDTKINWYQVSQDEAAKVKQQQDAEKKQHQAQMNHTNQTDPNQPTNSTAGNTSVSNNTSNASNSNNTSNATDLNTTSPGLRRLSQVQQNQSFDLSQYVMVTANIPVMFPTKSDEDIYNLFKSYMTLLLKVDYFFPLALNIFLTMPTFMVWTISNFLQVIEIQSYFNLHFSRNILTFQEATADFINLYNTIPNDLLYTKFIEPKIGGEINLGGSLKQNGIDTYIAQRSSNVLKNLLVFYLGFIGLFITILATGFVLKYFQIYCKGCAKPLLLIESRLMFNSIIRFVIETYTYVCLGVMVGLGNIHAVSTEQKLSSLFTMLFLLYVIAIPNLLYIFVRTYRLTLYRPEQKALYYALYLNVDTYKIQALSFTAFQLYRKLVLVVAAVIFSDTVLLQIGVALITSMLFMLYIMAYQPMASQFSNYVVIFHEIAIYLCSILTLVFSDVITSSEIRFQVANVWVGIIIVTLVLDSFSLFLSLVFKAKTSLERVAIKFQQERLRQKLIKEGKIKEVQQLNPYQKQVLAFKNAQAKAKRKQRRQMLRVLKARRTHKKEASDWSVPQTPHYSEGLQDIKNGFYEVFADDPLYQRLDFNEKRELKETPREEGVEEVLRFWPKTDLMNLEPDPEPFGDFTLLDDNTSQPYKQEDETDVVQTEVSQDNQKEQISFIDISEEAKSDQGAVEQAPVFSQINRQFNPLSHPTQPKEMHQVTKARRKVVREWDRKDSFDDMSEQLSNLQVDFKSEGEAEFR